MTLSLIHISTTRTFTVNILADNSDSLLKSGMICSTDIILSDESKVLVPVDSVISLPEGDSVFVLEGDKVKETSVTTGEISGDKMCIRDRQKAGQAL